MAPLRVPFGLASGPADLWRFPDPPSRPGLVLVHGLTPAGKDDPRVQTAASLLARAGFAVAVPDLPALRAQRLQPGDASVVRTTMVRLATLPGVAREPLTVLAVSVGVAPALAAVAEEERAGSSQPPIRLVVALGGYGESRELIRYFTTGAYRFDDVAGRVAVDPGLARAFLGANLDLVRDRADRGLVQAWLEGRPGPPIVMGPEGRAVLTLLQNRDPGQVDVLLDLLPAETRALLDALSPARYVRGLRARLLLVHGTGDPAVPFSESLRLAAAANPARTRLVLVGLVGHVEGRGGPARRLGDFLRLLGVTYEMFRR